MPRKAREKSATGIYAIVVIGLENIFESDKMREKFRTAAEKYTDVLVMRLSDNKAELLVRESASGISSDMKPLLTSFSRTYNRENGTTGKVFYGRFKSVPVETDAMLEECSAYLNGEDVSPAPFVKKARRGEKPAAKREVSKPRSVPAAKKEPKISDADKSENQRNTTMPSKKQNRKNDIPTWLL